MQHLRFDDEVPAADIMRMLLGEVIVAIVHGEVHNFGRQAGGRACIHLIARMHELPRYRQVIILAGHPRVHPMQVAQGQQA